MLAIAGAVLVLGTLIWFGLSHTGASATGPQGALVSKVTKVEEPSGGTKVTTTTEYGESLVIFGITLGAALLLCAAFYGRIREIKVAGIDLTLEPSEAAAVDKGVKAAAQTVPDGAKKAAIEPLAKTVARERAVAAILKASRGLPADQLEAIGTEATQDIVNLLS